MQYGFTKTHKNKRHILMEDKNTTIYLQLQKYLLWHKVRLKFLDLLIISLIRNRTISYGKNSVSLNDRVICSYLSRIQPLRRNFFFAEFIVYFDLTARILMTIIPI